MTQQPKAIIHLSQKVLHNENADKHYRYEIYHVPFTGAFDAIGMRQALIKALQEANRTIGVVYQVTTGIISVEVLYKQ